MLEDAVVTGGDGGYCTVQGMGKRTVVRNWNQYDLYTFLF